MSPNEKIATKVSSLGLPKAWLVVFLWANQRCPSQKENVYVSGWHPQNLEILTGLTHVGHLSLNGMYSYYYYLKKHNVDPT
jgi:hypothetical protein